MGGEHAKTMLNHNISGLPIQKQKAVLSLLFRGGGGSNVAVTPCASAC
jgi:hypothetical protein